MCILKNNDGRKAKTLEKKSPYFLLLLCCSPGSGEHNISVCGKYIVTAVNTSLTSVQAL